MRFPTGVNRDRFNLITAVLAKHARLKVCRPFLFVKSILPVLDGTLPSSLPKLGLLLVTLRSL